MVAQRGHGVGMRIAGDAHAVEGKARGIHGQLLPMGRKLREVRRWRAREESRWATEREGMGWVTWPSAGPKTLPGHLRRTPASEEGGEKEGDETGGKAALASRVRRLTGRLPSLASGMAR